MLEYLTKISHALQAQDAIPLFGKAPSFDLQKLSSLLARALHLEGLSLRIHAQKWVAKEELSHQKGQNIHAISIHPIQTPVYWAMSSNDLLKLTSFILLHSWKKKAFSSPILQEGYYRFLLLEALHAAQNLSPLQQMTLSLEEATSINEDAICMQLEITYEEHVMWGTFIIPKSFQHEWVQHFSALPLSFAGINKTIPLELGLDIGSITLSPKKWASLKPGDFLLPDRLAKQPNATLTFHHNPLFLVEIQDSTITLKEYAFTTEENMDKPTHNLSEQLELAEHEMKTIQDVPLNIHIEIAKLKISLNQLMQLKPGNFLDIPQHALQTVSLTLNGEKIGSAEIVSLGDTVGLKLLEI